MHELNNGVYDIVWFTYRGLFMEQELTAEEKWNKATLANNFIFYKVMRSHPEECKHLIEMLLKLKKL